MEQPTFEARWPELETQLRAALTRRRIPIDAREDILQETALRLLRNWDHVQPESLWAFALTVALNIVRDDARKKERHERNTFQDPVVTHDPEHEALVRLELDRVRVALTTMSERQRTILLSEIGEATRETSTPAQKMARMRARRRLRSLIEDASVFVALPSLRLRRWINDSDTALANTAASWAIRFAGLTTVAAVSVPLAVGGPAEMTPGAIDERSFATDKAAITTPAASARRFPNDPALSRRPAVNGVLPRVPGKTDEVNQHFGVVHKEGDSITVGGEKRIGPYAVEHSVGQDVAGLLVGAELRARYDAARCTNRFLQRPNKPCSRSGRLRGRIKAAVADKRHEVDVDVDRITTAD